MSGRGVKWSGIRGNGRGSESGWGRWGEAENIKEKSGGKGESERRIETGMRGEGKMQRNGGEGEQGVREFVCGGGGRGW